MELLIFSNRDPEGYVKIYYSETIIFYKIEFFSQQNDKIVILYNLQLAAGHSTVLQKCS